METVGQAIVVIGRGLGPAGRLLVSLETARGRRLIASERPRPRLLWAALIGGAVATIGFASRPAAESWPRQGMMVSCLASVIAPLRFLVPTLEYPLRGESGIQDPSPSRPCSS